MIAMFFACLVVAKPLFAQDSSAPLKLFNAGKMEEARVAALANIQKNSADNSAYLVLVWSLIEMEEWSDAGKYSALGYAIKKDPLFSEASGEALYFLGRNEQALSQFEEFVGSSPENPRAGRAYYYIGEIYLRMAKFDHADIAFSTALQYQPLKALWWARLGWARERLGNKDLALQTYKKALALDASIEDARKGIARIMSGGR